MPVEMLIFPKVFYMHGREILNGACVGLVDAFYIFVETGGEDLGDTLNEHYKDRNKVMRLVKRDKGGKGGNVHAVEPEPENCIRVSKFSTLMPTPAYAFLERAWKRCNHAYLFKEGEWIEYNGPWTVGDDYVSKTVRLDPSNSVEIRLEESGRGVIRLGDQFLGSFDVDEGWIRGPLFGDDTKDDLSVDFEYPFLPAVDIINSFENYMEKIGSPEILNRVI